MPFRTTPLVTDHVYHIYNRGVARQPIFFNKRDYQRFLLTLSYYRFQTFPVKLSRILQFSKDERETFLIKLNSKGEKLVEIISFALIRNHFHLLIKQLTDTGISSFLRRALNSYTRYFNTKLRRVGPLFQGAFKAVLVETNEQLIHLSRYIHLNPLKSLVVKESEFLSYPWSSLLDYLNNKSTFVDTELVLSQFSSSQTYKKFVFDHADYAKKLEKLKNLILEKANYTLSAKLFHSRSGR